MDIYQIIITHNRSWTIREIIAFAVVFLMAVFLAAVLLKLHKIMVIQAVCGLLLLTFLAIVFGSTVFTRTPGIRQYQLEIFWSWKEILGIGKCGRLGSTTGDGLLQENLLNILLLFPAGILLPGMTGRKLKWWMGLLVGIAVSSAIEISQLLLCRGLFEFDDIIHNSLGCMLGCLLGNRMLKLVHGKKPACKKPGRYDPDIKRNHYLEEHIATLTKAYRVQEELCQTQEEIIRQMRKDQTR